jgi:branched-chain amino acid transport system substrate-binding protein
VNSITTMRASALLAAMILLPAADAAAQTAKPWLVGQIAVLSGPVATVGTRLDQAVKLWAEEVNAAGGIAGRKVEVLTCDEENKPEKAVACASDMIDKGVVVIFANVLTASIQAIQPLVAKGPILLIPSPNVVPPADSFAFQVSATEEDNSKAIATYLKQNGITKIGMVAATDASGEVGVAVSKKVFGESNIELRLARIDLRAIDASTQLASVAGSDIPVVYSNYSGGGAVTVVKSYKNLGLQQPLIISYANISSGFVQLVKDVKPPHLLGTAMVSIVPELVEDAGDRERSKAFLASYQKRYGEPADMINVIGKAATDVADAVLRNVPNPADFPAVKKYLETTPIASVRTEHFSPTSHVGLGSSSVIIVELKDGVWTKADPVKRE